MDHTEHICTGAGGPDIVSRFYFEYSKGTNISRMIIIKKLPIYKITK